jgi:uncharacterized protein (DUF58 family)
MRGPFFLIVLFIIAVVLRIDFFFTIFYLFALVYALSHIWMQSTARRLTVQRRFDDHAFCGDQVQVNLDLHNGGWLPLPWVEAHESLPVQLVAPPFHRQVFSLGPGARRRLTYHLHCHQRGYYPIGPLTVRAGDLLGLVRPRIERADPAFLIVYPRIVSLEQLGLPTRSPQVVLPAQTPLFEDPARVIGVRDYQRGDSPRRIHWTASAKATSVAAADPRGGGQSLPLRLMVKQYQPAIARETLICLDMDERDYGQRQRYTGTELAVIVAASLANHIVVREGLPVGLLTEARDPLLNPEQNPVDADSGQRTDSGRRQAGDLSEATPRPPWSGPILVGRGRRERRTRNMGRRAVGLRGQDTSVGWSPALQRPTAVWATVARFALPPRSGQGHLMSLLEVLARIQTVSAASARLGPFVDLLRHAGTILSWGATLVIVTGRETEQLFDALLYLRHAGFAVSLILVQPGLPSEGLRYRSERLSVPVYRVWEERDLSLPSPMGPWAAGQRVASPRPLSWGLR